MDGSNNLDHATKWIELLSEFKSKKQPIALVTVTKVLGSAPCKVASKMIVNQQKEIFGTIGGGKVELIIEPMNKTPELYLFGAGHIGVELCNILKDTPFNITLLDVRENWKENLTIDKNITFSNIDFDLYKQTINWGPNCYVVIMTHDHKLDFEITALALHSETKYIGLIGSKTKKNKFNNMLKNELNFEAGISPVHCPVGLDLGGNSPKEIAISVAAELLKVHYAK